MLLLLLSSLLGSRERGNGGGCTEKGRKGIEEGERERER